MSSVSIPPEVIASFIGGSLGAAATLTAFLFKRADESRREIRNVIYDLLGIHRSLKAAKVLTPENYVAECLEAMGVTDQLKPDDLAQFKAVLEPLVKPQLDTLLGSVSSWSESEYLLKVDKIASSNPLLAHRLRANSLLKQVMPGLKNYWSSYLDAVSENEEVASQVRNSIPDVEAELLNALISDIRADSLKLARAVGIFEYLKILLWYRRDKRKTISRVVSPMLKKLLKTFAESNAPQQT